MLSEETHLIWGRTKPNRSSVARSGVREHEGLPLLVGDPQYILLLCSSSGPGVLNQLAFFFLYFRILLCLSLVPSPGFIDVLSKENNEKWSIPSSPN